jgi:glycerate kinase
VKILLVPDSFKGTMTAAEVCGILKKAALEAMPDADVRAFPAADGGEGTLDAVQRAAGGQFVIETATGASGQPVRARYLSLGDTAVIGLSETAGPQHRAPGFSAGTTTTFGAGQLALAAINAGHRHIVFALGGSATQDMGCGIAAALGTVFTDARGRAFLPTGNTLRDVRAVRVNPVFFKKEGIRISALCDVDNPLYGPQGAARVFGPQKGASVKEIELFDEGAKHLSQIFAKAGGARLNAIRGTGAAGGTGGGLVMFLNAALLSGAGMMLELMHFSEEAQKCDLIVTGEGRVDAQSAGGKLVSMVAGMAKGRPVAVLAGSVDPKADLAPLYEKGVTAVFSALRSPASAAEAMADAKGSLGRAARDLFRFAAAMHREH